MSLWNAKVTRVDQPEPGLLSLSLRAEGRNEVLIAVALPGTLSVGVVGERLRGASASPAISQLRRHVEGARIEAVELSRRAARLTLRRADKLRYCIVAPSKPYGAWWLCESDGSLVLRSPGAPSAIPQEQAHLVPKEPGELRALGPEVLKLHQSMRREQLRRALDRHIKRVSAKRDAIRADLERASKADELREQADLLLANASEIPPTSRYFETTRWGDDTRSIRIELDPAKSPAALAQELYAKAKRLRRGLRIAPDRLGKVEEELSELTRVRDELGEARPGEIEARLGALGVVTSAPREQVRRQRQAGERVPYREFLTVDASSVLVGRSAADNDRLTLRVARPHDLWLHARGVTGAHVVVPLTKGKTCAPETLVDAATLAAHFSDLRGEPIVDVLYTPRRFVNKRKGSPVGSVTLGREKVIALRVEPDRLRRLLDAEKKTR